MKIFIDFDRCVFDVERLYDLLANDDKPEHIKTGTHESLEYLDALEPSEDWSGLASLVYSDFFEFATERKKMGDEIVLVSSPAGYSGEWETDYQKEKILRSKIEAFVDHVEITDQKGAYIASQLHDGERYAYIEDSPEHLSVVSQAVEELKKSEGIDFHVHCFQMLRKETRRAGGGGIEKITPLKEFPVVKSFEPILNELSKLDNEKKA